MCRAYSTLDLGLTFQTQLLRTGLIRVVPVALGTYLEVEIMSENLTDAECRILDLLDSLELTEREMKSYLELVYEG